MHNLLYLSMILHLSTQVWVSTISKGFSIGQSATQKDPVPLITGFDSGGHSKKHFS